MKMREAMSIIEHGLTPPGYMVHFERVKGSVLESDYFPDKHDGEKLIPFENEAWALARRFAEQTRGRCVNIYVVDGRFRPVRDYEIHRINNRTKEGLRDVDS